MTYDGPKTLSSAMRGAPKRDKNGRHLTVIQRLVGKYGIEQGSKIYRHLTLNYQDIGYWLYDYIGHY